MSVSKYASFASERPKPMFAPKELHILDEEIYNNGGRTDIFQLKLSVQEMMVYCDTYKTMVPKEVYVNIRLYKNSYHQCGVSVTASEAIWMFDIMKNKMSVLERIDGVVEVIPLSLPHSDNGYKIMVSKKEKKSSLSIDKGVVNKLEQLVAAGLVDRMKSICDLDGISIKHFA